MALPETTTRYRLIGPDGRDAGTYDLATVAASRAGNLWPGVAQRDHDNGAEGWDIELVR